MGFMDKLLKLLAPAPNMQDYGFWINVKCNRCGEVLRVRINLANDLSSDYSDNASANTYFCRKVIVGDKLCFQKIEVKLNFNSKRKLTAQEISGGEFVEE